MRQGYAAASVTDVRAKGVYVRMSSCEGLGECSVIEMRYPGKVKRKWKIRGWHMNSKDSHCRCSQKFIVGGDGSSPPPLWDILFFSQKEFIFLNIRPP